MAATFARDSAQMLLWRVGVILLGLVTASLLARGLGPADRGTLAILLLSVSLVTVVLQVGFPEATVYVVGAGLFPEREVKSTLLGYFAGLGTLLALPAHLLMTRVLDMEASRSGMLVAAVVLSLVIGALRFFLLARKRFARYGLSVAIEGSVYLSAVVALWFLGSLTVDTALFGFTGGLLVALLVLLAWEARYEGGLGVTAPRLRVLRECLRYGIHLFAVGVGGFAVQRISYFLLQFLSGSRAVGLFTAANTLPNLFSNLPQQVATVMYSHVATQEERSYGNRLTVMVVKLMTLAFIPTIIAVAVFATPIVRFLFGPEFLGIQRPMVILSAGAAAAGLGTMLFNSLAGVGLQRYGSRMALVTVVVVTVLCYLWIPRWGVEGAAWAYLVASVMNLIVFATLFVRHSGMSAGSLLFFTSAESRLVASWVTRR